MDEKDPKKLTAEELEKRVAPMALTYSDPTAPSPTDPATPTTTPSTSTSLKQGHGGGIGGGKHHQ